MAMTLLEAILKTKTIKNEIKELLEANGIDMTGVAFEDYPQIISDLINNGGEIGEQLEMLIINYANESVEYDGTENVEVNLPILEKDKKFYIDSVNGSDDTGDGSQESPFASVNYALSISEQTLTLGTGVSNTFVLAEGTYDNLLFENRTIAFELLGDVVFGVIMVNNANIRFGASLSGANVSCSTFGLQLNSSASFWPGVSLSTSDLLLGISSKLVMMGIDLMMPKGQITINPVENSESPAPIFIVSSELICGDIVLNGTPTPISGPVVMLDDSSKLCASSLTANGDFGSSSFLIHSGRGSKIDISTVALSDDSVVGTVFNASGGTIVYGELQQGTNVTVTTVSQGTAGGRVYTGAQV